MPPEGLIGSETTETTSEENTTTETEEQTTTENETTDDGVSTQETQVQFPEGLDEELQKDPSLQVFIKDGKINYANLMKSYVHGARQMGADKVVVPGVNASNEEREAFFNKLGRPDLDKYEVKSNLPEGVEVDQVMVDGFKAVAHKAGILPGQAQDLMNWFNEQQTQAGTTLSDQNQADYDKSVEGLKTEWGDGYDRELIVADRALKEFATTDEIKYLNDIGITSDVNFTRLFNKIGKGLSEDTFNTESHGHFGMTQAEAEVKVNEALADPNSAYRNKDHANHKNAVAELQKWHEIMAG